MRKNLKWQAFCFAFFLETSSWPIAAADNYYPDYWQNDHNYPLVWGHMGTAWYLDKNSLNVEIKDPPYYIITANTVIVTDAVYQSPEFVPRVIGTTPHRFFFDEDETDMRTGDAAAGTWRYLRPQGSNAEAGLEMNIGEAVFYLTQGRKFYGNFLWKHINQGKAEYWDVFGDKYYKKLE